MSLDKVQRLGVRSEEVGERAAVAHRARLRHPAVRRAPPVRGRAQVRRLDREALRQRHRRRREGWPEAVRRLQPRAERPAAGMAGRAAAAPTPPTSCAISTIPKRRSKSCAAATRRSRTVAIPSPVAGTVIDKIAVEGMRFQPGDDAVPHRRHLEHVGDGRGLRAGPRLREGRATPRASPSTPGRAQPFDGKVTFIYPNDRQGKPHRAAAHRGRQSRRPAARRHGGHRRDRDAARRQSRRGAGLGGDRQRATPGRAGRARRGPLRAARRSSSARGCRAGCRCSTA